MDKKFYVTTPIYYVNDSAHIGHACTTLAADIIARYQNQLGKESFFLTGTDEHGAKIAEAAEKENLSPKRFCDQVSQRFRQTWPKFNIKYNYFIRTTNPQHEKIAQEFIQKLYQKGDIFKDKYEGYYCVGCEKFITETELINSKCPYHPNKEIQKQSEENYFFKLKKYLPQVVEAIEKNHYQIVPDTKKREVLSKLKTGLNEGSLTDLSVSRANVPWGIPIPWDKSQTIYVWFEALLNYYSAPKIVKKESLWPPDLHIIAKEILWFHTVIWPAMLLAAKISLPKRILVHSFYTVDGQKMSKSIGNVISPDDLINKFGVDGTRYLIASSFPLENDADVSWKRFTQKYNADLANGLGNLVSRVAKLCQNSGFNFPQKATKKTTWSFSSQIKAALAKYRFDQALEVIRKYVTKADKYLDQTKPWEKTNHPDLKQNLKVVLGLLSLIAWELKPFLPETAETIERTFTAKKITAPEKPLFPRIQE